MEIAVIAGTPVDTRMGVELLLERGAGAIGFPISRTPEEQTVFQVSPRREKEEAVGAVLDAVRSRGLERVLLYCNSLSASVDAHALADARGLRIWTPMDVYGEVARRHRCLGVLAANCQGAAGVERAMVNASPDTVVIGAGEACAVAGLSAARAGEGLGIEAGREPEELLADCGAGELLRFFEENGAEAVVLGCTHFPYLLGALRKKTALPVIDPARRLLELVLAP